MSFQPNDILFDVKFPDCFYYNPATDKVAIDNFPGRFRLATAEEIKAYPPDEALKAI